MVWSGCLVGFGLVLVVVWLQGFSAKPRTSKGCLLRWKAAAAALSMMAVEVAALRMKAVWAAAVLRVNLDIGSTHGYRLLNLDIGS